MIQIRRTLSMNTFYFKPLSEPASPRAEIAILWERLACELAEEWCEVETESDKTAIEKLAPLLP